MGNFKEMKKENKTNTQLVKKKKRTVKNKYMFMSYISQCETLKFSLNIKASG